MKKTIWGLAIGGLAVLGTALSASLGAGMISFEPSDLKLNEIQALGTHNSYHIRPSASKVELFETLHWITAALVKTISYTHPPLTEQFDGGIRQIELDVFADPDGGHYAEPVGLLLIEQHGLPSPPDFDPTGMMHEPGLKVLHTPDIDFRSICLTFKRCLEEIEAWSEANPEHIPILVLVEAKESALPNIIDTNGQLIEFTTSLEFDAAAVESIDREIRSVFSEAELLTPDDVRGNYATLNQAILDRGWPTLEASKGKVIFSLDNTGPIRDLYLEGHPSLAGRVMFVSAEPGMDEAAFLRRNDPFDREIPELVRQGYIVRTRADADTLQARFNDTAMRDAALNSGAQYISTDFPEPDEYFSDYSVRFPEDTLIRCNPINSSPSCRVWDFDVVERSQ